MSSDGKTKNLKAWNLPWLCSLATFDAIALYVILFPETLATTPLAQFSAARITLSTAIPVLVVLAAAVLSAHVKACLVYWKWIEPLPGHRAFSQYGPADTRIDMDALRKNVGALPTQAREQNALWYKLYRKVGSEVGVADAHKAFLLFRDMAAISFLLLIATTAVLIAVGTRGSTILTAAGLFGVQYVLTVLAARNSGIRFVTTVLAEHAVRRVTAAAPRAKA